MSEYEPRVLSHTEALLSVLSEKSGSTLNASLWFNFYSFDVIGDVVFGKSFEMLGKGKEHFAVKLLHEAMKVIGILSPIPWALPMASKIPGATEGYLRFLKYCDDIADAREKVRFS